MKTALAWFTLLLTSLARAEEPPKAVEPEKEKAANSLDARIESLQNTKACIAAAKTKIEIETCRRSIQLKARVR